MGERAEQRAKESKLEASPGRGRSSRLLLPPPAYPFQSPLDEWKQRGDTWMDERSIRSIHPPPSWRTPVCGLHRSPSERFQLQPVTCWWCSLEDFEGHFTHEPRAVTMTLREPKRKVSKGRPNTPQNHVVWSQIFKCSVKPLFDRALNQMLFQWIFIHVSLVLFGCECLEYHGLSKVLC